MNHQDLDEALQELATGSSNAASVRAAVAHRMEARRRQRRSVALVAAAAAVVLLIGGIGVLGASRRSAPPATQPDQRPGDPGVSRLIPYVAPLLISPVTLTAGGPPPGYVANRSTDANSLLVDWPDADYTSPDFHGPVGYQIDRTAAFGSLRSTSGDVLTKPAQVISEQVVINGHPAEFNRTPDGTKQYFALAGLGNGVRMWLTWKLSDGSYIHVWSTGDQRTELLTLANGIVEKPSTLDSYLTLGLTLPGLTVRATTGIRESAQYASSPLYETISLCPVGTPSGQTTRTGSNDRCLAAAVAQTSAQMPAGEVVGVAGRPVHMIAADRMAWIDLGRGYTASVRGPIGMSAGDLALAVVSIRLDPQVPAAPTRPMVTQAVPSGFSAPPPSGAPTPSSVAPTR